MYCKYKVFKNSYNIFIGNCLTEKNFKDTCSKWILTHTQIGRKGIFGEFGQIRSKVQTLDLKNVWLFPLCFIYTFKRHFWQIKLILKNILKEPKAFVCLNSNQQTIANEIIVAFANSFKPISVDVSQSYGFYSTNCLLCIVYLYVAKYGTYCLEIWSIVWNAINLTWDSNW